MRSCFAWPLLVAALAPAQEAPTATERARGLLERFPVPTEARAAAREFTTLGADALPTVHRALHDTRPVVVQWTLYAAASLRCDLASLRDPIRALARSKNPGIALAAQKAWPAIDGRGSVLVADYVNDQVLLCDAEGCTPLTTGQPMVMSAMPLVGGGHLLAVHQSNRIVEMDAKGNAIWFFVKAIEPCDADRLPNGNTLIADTGNERVIEVDQTGDVVWSYEGQIRPIDADWLPDGNVLISNYEAGGTIEVDRAGKVVWQFPGENIRDADRLLDGTTLLAMTDQQRVLLVDRAGVTLREWKFNFEPNDCELLADGHLVASGNRAVVELDADGQELWRQRIGHGSRVLRLGARKPTTPAAVAPATQPDR